MKIHNKNAVTMFLGLLLLALLVPNAHAASPEAENAELLMLVGDMAGAEGLLAGNASAWLETIERLGRRIGDDDETMARAAEFALERLATSASAPGSEGRYRIVEQGLTLLAGPDYSVRTRRHAIALLGRFGTGADAVAMLGECLGDADVREHARRALERMASIPAGQALLEALPEAKDVPFRCGLMNSLGSMGFFFAIPPIMKEANSDSMEVRMAARDALARMPMPNGRPAILKGLKAGDKTERARAYAAYMDLGETNLWAGEMALGMYDAALAQAKTDEERAAAVVGIGRIEDLDSIPRLAALLTDDSIDVRHAAQHALIRMSGTEPTERLHALAERADAEKRAALLLILAARGDDGLDGMAEDALKSDHSALLLSGIELAGTLQHFDAQSRLEKAAKKGTGAERATALLALADLADARLEQGEQKKARKLYHFVFDNASVFDAQVRAMQGMLALNHPSSLERYETILAEQSPLHEEAIRGVLARADAYRDKGKKRKARNLYAKVYEKSAAYESVLRSGEALLALGKDIELAERMGFITDWMVVGPFPFTDEEEWEQALVGEPDIDLDQEYESLGMTLAWQQVHTEDPQGIVDIAKLYDVAENTCAYAYATIEVPSRQLGMFKIGSDDGVVVRLNGEVLLADLSEGELVVDGNMAYTWLEPGKNEILLKIFQYAGDWQFCVRFANLGGHRSLVQTGPASWAVK